jgi:hypothetical protein
MKIDFCGVARVLMSVVISTICLLVLLATYAGARDKYIVYVGTYTDHGSWGIYVCEFDATRQFLYTVNETDQFMINQRELLAHSRSTPPRAT